MYIYDFTYTIGYTRNEIRVKANNLKEAEIMAANELFDGSSFWLNWTDDVNTTYWQQKYN